MRLRNSFSPSVHSIFRLELEEYSRLASCWEGKSVGLWSTAGERAAVRILVCVLCLPSAFDP